MSSIFAALTDEELGNLRNAFHGGYQALLPMPANNYGLMNDLSYLLHEISRVETGRDPSRAVERHWTGA